MIIDYHVEQDMSATTEPIQVLHVDDEPMVVDLASSVIQKEHDDISIHPETDPRKCRQQLERDSLPVDCIVSDYDMPHLNGLELLEIVRENHPKFPFILSTSQSRLGYLSLKPEL